jgi:hypothetical protein
MPKRSRPATQLMCPSAPPDADAVVHGVLTEGKRIAHISPPLPISAVGLLPEGSERVIRFANTCVEAGCGNWDPSDSRCGVLDALSSPGPPDTGLPACGIRHSCRWYAQSGAAACNVCNHTPTRLATGSESAC